MTLRTLDQSDLLRYHDALLIDLRPIASWVAGHARGSIPLLYELGPGFATRARDTLPLDSQLVMIEDTGVDIQDASARLRGKGFDVVGKVQRELVRKELTTKDYPLPQAPEGMVLVDVADPGVVSPPTAIRLPVELLWKSSDRLPDTPRLGVLAGYGVRAAIAAGILEKLGVPQVHLVRTLPADKTPAMATGSVFRVGGPG